MAFNGASGVAELLGGRRVLGREVDTPLQAHDLLLEGLPGAALDHLIQGFTSLRWGEPMEAALGMSLRTYQRRKEAADAPLNRDQSGRTWKLAEILRRTTAMLGSREEAEAWLQRPAIGLEGRRPIELLATPAGVELLETFLGRLEYGVYT